MHILKLLLQEPQVWPTTPRRDLRPPWAQPGTTTWGTVGYIPAIVFQRETDTTRQRPGGQLTAQGKNAEVFYSNFP